MNSRIPDADSLSWSLSRERLFAFCPRAFYFQHHAAVAGFEQHAPERLRLLFRLKHLQPGKRWPEIVLRSAVRDFFLQGFYHETPDKSGLLQRLAFKELSKGKRNLALEEWRQDPKLLNLEEVYYGGVDIQEIFAEAEQQLCGSLDAFTSSPLFPELCALDQLDWLDLPLPCQFMLGNIQVWASPLLAWRKQGFVSFLQFGSDKQAELITALHKLLAATMNIQPENAETIFCNPANGDISGVKNHQVNISTAINRIRDAATALPTPNAENEALFQKNPDNCANCRFREYCV